MEIEKVNIFYVKLKGTWTSHTAMRHPTTANKPKISILLLWKWKTCITQHARMQNQTQIENQRLYKQR